MLKIKNNFNLDNTITCGQIFRFKKIDNMYIVILPDRIVSLEAHGEDILIDNGEKLKSNFIW